MQKTHIYTFILLLLASTSSYAQVTKLPTYAIQTTYRVNKANDTLAPKGGGQFVGNPYEYIDSIIYTYNNRGQIDRETIWRYIYPYTYKTNSSNFQPLDTARNFRQHYYDSLGRKVSVRHGSIYGSPHPSNFWYYQLPPLGATYYFEVIQRIDSMAYDSHGSKIFTRRYENYDFGRGNFTMVVKNCGYDQFKLDEVEYQYDNLNRISKEKRYEWYQNVRYLTTDYTAQKVFDFTYKYVGNTNRIQSRTYPYLGSSLLPNILKDTLFRYDSKGRVVSFRSVGYYYNNGTNIEVRYDFPSAFPFPPPTDTVVYFDNNGSYQRKYINCDGKKYYPDGRLYYEFQGNYPGLYWCFPSGSNTGGNSYTRQDSLDAKNNFLARNINHYQKDAEGNIVARDSSYFPCSYGGYPNLYSNDSFYPNIDTIAYYGFRPITEVVTAVLEGRQLQASQLSLVIYPNPSTEGQINLQSTQAGQALLYNYLGEQVGVYMLNANQTLTVAVEHLPKGLYFVQQNQVRKKVIIN